MNSSKLFLALFTLFISLQTQANFNFSDLTAAEVGKMSDEIGANFSHSTLRPGTPMGEIFGFQVGVVVGATSSSELEKLAKEEDPTTELARIPNAGLMAALTIPYGITLEATLLPSLDSDNAELSNMSGGITWSFYEYALFDFALRGHFASGELKYTDIVDSISSEVTIEHSSIGAHFLASMDLPLITPYVGLGFISQDTDWGINTSATLFNFTSSGSTSASGSSAHVIAGAEINLLILNIGVEYASMLDTDRISAKVSFGF